MRICGLWGGWSSKPPYKPEAPSLELSKQLGMGWLTSTPIAHDRARQDGLRRDGAAPGRAQLDREVSATYRPLIINLGNEPHGTGERVLRNVAAYAVVYEEIKKVDPTIPVVATSVEPNEEYFKPGYGKWCDAYDFHVYETSDERPPDDRASTSELMKKYGT